MSSMRDYKSPLQTTKKHVARKLLLFVLIASVATLYFLKQEPVSEPTPEKLVQVKPLTLPNQTPRAPKPEGIEKETVTEQQQDIPDSSTQVEDTPLFAVEDSETTQAAEPPQAEGIATTEEIPITASMSASWEVRTIKSGDSLANIFKEWKLSPSTLHKIVSSSKLGKTLADIHPGETLRLLKDDDGSLLELVVERSPTESLLIEAQDGKYIASLETREVDVKQAYAKGEILTSLFIDGQKAGLTDAQIMEMAGIFGWDIDFALEIRKGDSFELLYEEHFLDGEKLRNGPILAARFRNGKKTYEAVRFTDHKDNTSYYDPKDGRNKKRAFIRTPVKFARISSGFTKRRFHPVLKKWRSHRGVDYAAPTGTPVKATGKGKVIFRGTKSGYGKVIFIQHGSKYTTVYAHLSRYAKASRKGNKVRQGQIIGYVGMTGLATGPHLHYEFRVNGVHRNPLTVKLPKAEPIKNKYKKDFLAQTAPLMRRLENLSEQQIAKLDADE